MIKINNKEYGFKFGFKAMVAYEEGEGSSFSEMGKNVRMSDLVNIAFYGINAASKVKITKEALIDAIDEDPTLLTTISAATEKDIAAFSLLREEAKK